MVFQLPKKKLEITYPVTLEELKEALAKEKPESTRKNTHNNARKTGTI